MINVHATPPNETYHHEHLVDRAAMLAMRAMLALQPAADLGTSGRAAFDELMAKTPAAENVLYEAAVVGGIPGWWCRPIEASSEAAILYLHGGAYVVGSAQAYRHFAGQIAARAKLPVFIADYGLAPERPFPAAVDDAEAAYRGLALAGFSSIAVAGDSAGGGLALVTAARMTSAARTDRIPRPFAVCVMSPWIDLALASESIETRAARDPLLSRSSLEGARQRYLGMVNANDPRASPVYGDLAGLPPVLLHVGEDEVLLDDARRYSNPAGRLNSMSGRAWCTSSPPIFLSCGPHTKRWTSSVNSFDASAANIQSPNLKSRNQMTRILFVGQKPETVDFSDPSLPPGFDAAKINAGIAVAVAKIKERGWEGDTCMITPDAAGSAMLKKTLGAAPYDCVVIGGGLRIPPKSLALFEIVVNIIHKAAPGAAIAFNTKPEDTAEAAARQLNAD